MGVAASGGQAVPVPSRASRLPCAVVARRLSLATTRATLASTSLSVAAVAMSSRASTVAGRASIRSAAASIRCAASARRVASGAGPRWSRAATSASRRSVATMTPWARPGSGRAASRRAMVAASPACGSVAGWASSASALSERVSMRLAWRFTMPGSRHSASAVAVLRRALSARRALASCTASCIWRLAAAASDKLRLTSAPSRLRRCISSASVCSISASVSAGVARDGGGGRRFQRKPASRRERVLRAGAAGLDAGAGAVAGALRGLLFNAGHPCAPSWRGDARLNSQR